ncbi:MAG: hypothetical protein Q4G30_07420 [Actinomycetaceae bacterium]|nr:hypothetical protein [Actinomycetaceae bacterium]
MTPPEFLDSLTYKDGQRFHLLALADDVQTQELEALALSIWDDAGWIRQGLLRLTGEAYLSGPWEATEEVAQSLGLPSWSATAYLLSVPALRGAPVPPELAGCDELLDAFPEGCPEGLELEVLTGLRAMARRLAGALRLATGPVVIPDPDASVGLRIISDLWLSPPACVEVVRPVLPDAHSSLEETEADLPNTARARRIRLASIPTDKLAFDRDGLRRRAVAELSSDERAWLHAEADAFDEVALAQGDTLDSYAIMGRCGASSEVHIHVHEESDVPRAVGAAPDEGVISYDILWVPRDLSQAYGPRLSRSMRLERLKAASLIELIAKRLIQEAGGWLLDEDGFLVEL